MMAFRENKNCTKRLQITNYQKVGKDIFENVEKNCFLVKFGTQQAKMITSFSANNEYGPKFYAVLLSCFRNIFIYFRKSSHLKLKGKQNQRSPGSESASKGFSCLN